MFVFELPEIGEGVVEGEIVRWLVQEGQAVAVDQPICEIMTDKATVEITTPKAGVISTLHGVDGDVIKVHTPLVDIDEDGTPSAEAPTATLSAPPAPKPSPAPAPKAAPSAPIPAPTATACPHNLVNSVIIPEGIFSRPFRYPTTIQPNPASSKMAKSLR